MTDYLNDPVTGTMAEKYVSGSTTTWHDYIRADGGIAGERFNTAGTVTWRYFVNDHLGSSSVLTDGSGTVQERLSYDAWGKRRNANGSDNTTCSITSATTRGFTGHEMMDSVCLINTNARVYDPSIGRFMSADSIVPDPLNSQSFNRYSYVNNMALSATDPTGHDTDCPQCKCVTCETCFSCYGPDIDSGTNLTAAGNYVLQSNRGYELTGTYSVNISIPVDLSFDPNQDLSSSTPSGPSLTETEGSYDGSDSSATAGYGAGSGLGSDSGSYVNLSTEIWTAPGGQTGTMQTNGYTGNTGWGNGGTVYIDNGAGMLSVLSGGSLSWRDNNPGNIKGGSFASSHGGIGNNGKFAIFPSYPTGYKALIALLYTPNYQSMNVSSVIRAYAPASDNNNPAAYADFITNTLGVSLDTQMSTLSSSQIDAMGQAIQTYEGRKVGSTSNWFFNF